jgi:TP901 family phage tail tape measure protein
MTLRTVGVRLTAEIAEYQSKLKAAGQSTRDFKGELDKASKKGSLDAVANTAAGVGVALAGMAAYAIKSAADFDKSMSAVAAATHAPADQIAQLRAAAIQAGKDTQYSATQAADGITELSKAGVSTADVLGGGLKGALSLAAAGQLSVGEAAETAASAMTQFKLKGDEVPHIADLLAAAAGKAQGSVHDMGYALSQSGLVAAQFGLSVEDTTGVLAEFASAGLLGSDAGTSLKTMLLALANPSAQTAKQMHALGISFYDSQGKFVGLSGVAEVLRQKLSGLTDQQRQAALGQIFGNDAIRAASVLYADGAKGVEAWKSKVNDAGYASSTAGALTNNLAGDIERLKGSVETLAIESGSGANGGLRVLTKGLNDVVNQFANLPPAVGSATTVIAAVSGAALLGLAGWVKLRKGIADAAEQLSAMGPAGEKAAGALGKVTSAAGKASLVLVGLETVELVAEHFHSASVNVDRLTDSLTNFSNTGKTSGELTDVFGTDLKNLAANAQTADAASHGFWGGLNDLTTSIPGVHAAVDTLNESIYGLSFNKAKDNMAALDQALTNYMTTTGDARKASDLWNRVVEQSGLDIDQITALLPNAYKEVGALNTAADKSTGAVGGMANAAGKAASKTGDLGDALKVSAANQKGWAGEAEAAAGAARHEIGAMTDLNKRMKAQVDPVFALLNAESELTAARKEATKAVSKYGRNSDQAKESTQKLTTAAINMQGAAGALSTSFNGKMTPAFRETLKAAGLTDKQIQDVAKQFRQAKVDADKYTGKYPAQVSAPGAVQSKKEIEAAARAAHYYHGQYTADVRVTGASKVEAEFRKLSAQQQALKSGNTISRLGGGFATGGPVFGAGSTTSDSIPAMLSNGEHVWTAKEVEAAGGHGAVMAMRSMALASGRQLTTAVQHGQVPREILTVFASGALGKMGDLPVSGLAQGGPVSWPFPVSAAKTKVPTWDEVMAKMGGAAGPFLHAQDGKPYVWASAGPGGYDCSGIVSAVYNLLHGKNPYSHTFSTSSLPGGYFPKPGIGGPLTAAWSNPGEYPASSSTGHMMGMAGGLTFESSGSRGVHLGGTTRRLTDFAHIAHYAQGGHVGMANGGTITEPVFGIGASGRTYSFGENYQPERVMPQWQTGGHGGGGTTVHVTFSGPVGSRRELQTWLTGAFDDLKRRGKV